MQYVNIQVNVTGNFKDGLQALQDLRTRNPAAIDVACARVAIDSSSQLKQNILSGKINRHPLTPMTLAKRQKGKPARPRSPEIKAWGGSTALGRSGTYIHAIFPAQRRKMHWVVSIENKKGFYSGGKVSEMFSIPEYARQLEYGFSKNIQATARMIAYLKILAGVLHGPFKKKNRANLDRKVNKVIKINVRPRPLWRLTWRELSHGYKGLNIFLEAWRKNIGNADFANLLGP